MFLCLDGISSGLTSRVSRCSTTVSHSVLVSVRRPRDLFPPGDLEVKTHTTERVPVEESTPLRRARRAAESLGYTVTPTSVHDDEWSLQIIAHRR